MWKHGVAVFGCMQVKKALYTCILVCKCTLFGSLFQIHISNISGIVVCTICQTGLCLDKCYCAARNTEHILQT